MIDSSGTVVFDLEKAWASIAHYRIENTSNVDTESALKEVVDQANLAEDALAEIERLRAEISEQKGMIWKTQQVKKEQAAQIKELEDAHKRSGLKYAKIINELRSSVYAKIPSLQKQWDDVLAEGKIGPDARPRSWQITEERVGLLEY